MANDSILIQVQLGSPTKANINAVTKQIQSALSNVSANVQIQNGRQAVQTLQNLKRGADNASRSMNSFGEAIGLSGRRFLAFTSAVAVVGRLTSALSQATREAIKFEREFVKLAQVFDTDVKSLGRLQNSMSELAQEFGLSATVIARTSVVLAQSGLTARQTEQAMRTLAKTTLAATFDSIAASTEGAVAIMAQFGTEANRLESQLGAINAVSKKFAVESGDIIEAVRRSGGAFRAAGGTLNEFIALFTSVRSTTRESAETIATGFRTIFARLQRPKTIDFFRQLNIELTDGRGNFIGAFEAVRRLSDGLKRAGIEAGSIQFAGVVEQLGGIRQVSRVIPLLQQFTKAEKARQVAVAGAGSLDADAAKAQETLSQAFARTTENFRALIREISQTQTFQAIVRIALDLANAFIEVARSLKPLIPLIATFAGFKLSGVIGGALKKGFGGAGGTGGLGKGFNKGGKVLGFNRGGTVPGTGSGDTVPAMLEPGEFVIRKSAVQAFGADRLAGINKYNNGGKTGKRRKRRRKPTDLGSVGMIVPRLGKDGRDATETITFNNKKFVADVKVSSVTKNSRKFTSEEQKLENALSDSVDSFGLDEVAKKSVIGKSKAALGQLFEEIVVQTAGLNKPGSNLLDIPRVARSGINKIIRDPLSNVTSADIKRTNNQKNRKDVVRKIAQIRSPKRKAAGGSISGADTVPALLTPGEFVVNKQSAKSFGYGNLRKINKYNKGGVVQKFQNGGTVAEGDGGFFQFPKVDDKPFKVVGKTMQQQNEELKKNIKAKKAQTEQTKKQTKEIGSNTKKTVDATSRLAGLTLILQSGGLLEPLSELGKQASSQIGINKELRETIAATVQELVTFGIGLQLAGVNVGGLLKGGIGKLGGKLGGSAIGRGAGGAFKAGRFGVAGKGLFSSIGSGASKGVGAAGKAAARAGKSFGIFGKALGAASGAIGGFTGFLAAAAAPLILIGGAAALATKAINSYAESAFDLKGLEEERQAAIKKGDPKEAVRLAKEQADATKQAAELTRSGGTAAGIAIGAAVGSFVPIIGTAVGVVVGGLVGFGTSLLLTSGETDKAFKEALVSRTKAEAELNNAINQAAFNATKNARLFEQGKSGEALQNIGKELNASAKAVEDAKRNLETQKTLKETVGGSVKEEDLEKANETLTDAQNAQAEAVKRNRAEVAKLVEGFAKANPQLKTLDEVLAAMGPQGDVIRQQIEADRKVNGELADLSDTLNNSTQTGRALGVQLRKEAQERRTQIEILKKQNALIHSLNETVNALTLSAQRSADALANVKAAADLTATSTFGASGAEQLGDITNIVDPQKFSQALGKAVSLGFSPNAARQVSRAATASRAIRRPGGISESQSQSDIEKFVRRQTGDKQIQSSVSAGLDKLFQEAAEKGQVVDPQAVQQLLEDNLVKPSQEAANKMAEGLKANAERLNNFAASLDVYADSINKVRASQREQLESQIDFAKRLKEATGGTRSKSDLVRETRARQAQTLGGQTTFQGQSLINNPKLVGEAIRKLQKEINERGKAIRAGVGDENLAILQKDQQERLKDLNKTLDEQIDALKDFQDVLIEDVKLAKQKQDQVKEELKNLLQKNVAQRKEGVNVEVATSGFLKGAFDKRLLTTGGLAGAAQARGLSGEQAETLERQRQLVVANLEKLAAADDKRAQALLKGLKTEELYQDIRAKLIGEANLELKGKRLTVAKLKEIDKDARKQAKEQLDIAQGKGVQQAADKAKVGAKVLGQAQKQQEQIAKSGAGIVGREIQSEGVLNQTQIQDVQQQQANAVEETAKFGKIGVAQNRRGIKTNRQGFRQQGVLTQQAGQDTVSEFSGGIGAVAGILSGILQVEDRGLHIISLAGHQSVRNAVLDVLGAVNTLVRIQGGAIVQPAGQGVTSLLEPFQKLLQQGNIPLTYNKGGVVYANEGTLVNYQPKGTDTVPAMLTPGEFVVRKSSVDKYGTGMMKAINSGSFANGGKVNYLQGGGNALFRPGLVTATTQLLSESVRNFGSFLSGGSLDNFASSVNTLVSSEGFGAFSQAVNKFEEIPKEFTMTVAPTQVTVSINGAEILAQIMPEIQSEILSQTSFKIEEFRQQLKSGDV